MMKNLQTAQWFILTIGMILLLGVISACGNEDDPARPTNEPTLLITTQVADLPSRTPTNTVTPGGPTLTPSPTFPPTVTLQSVVNTAQPDGPTSVPPTIVPEPYIHKVVEGDTCGGIAVRYGLDLAGSAAITEANEGLNCRSLRIGQDLIIPRPTGTPTPEGFDITQTAIATALPSGLASWATAVYDYCPISDDTLTSIALKNGTTQRKICELNPLPDGLDCSGCDFSESSVGFCPIPPVISEFNCLLVPGPTHTPTFTPTFTGLETATPTPTYAAPQAIQPADGTTKHGQVRLTWLSAGQLQANEQYMVTIIDEVSADVLFDVTTHPDYLIPEEWIPEAGQSRTITWKVEVVVANGEGLYVPVSGTAHNHRFTWQG